MEVLYRKWSEYNPVDTDKLRPDGSYTKLISERNYVIKGLMSKYGHIPNDLLIERVCPTCGSNNFTHELTKDHMNLVSCRECALIYVNPIFDDQHYKNVYSSEEYQEIVAELGHKSHEYRVQRFGVERVGIMSRYLNVRENEVPRYLDVGCSTGFVVETAKNKGWHATGIDLNPSAIHFGKSRGLDLRVSSLEECSFSQETFHAISLFDVLEHVLTPRKVLGHAIRLLRPNGIIFLYVPNYDSASHMLMGENAHFIWPTHHLTYFTPETLVDLVRRMGLSIEMTMTEGLDIADYIWRKKEVENKNMEAIEEIADVLQFMINAGCYGKNLRLIARKTGQ